MVHLSWIELAFFLVIFGSLCFGGGILWMQYKKLRESERFFYGEAGKFPEELKKLSKEDEEARHKLEFEHQRELEELTVEHKKEVEELQKEVQKSYEEGLA